MRKYNIRVNHSLGFFSFYEIEAPNGHDATQKAKKQFLTEFCGGTLGDGYSLETFIINNPDKYDLARNYQH